MGQAEKKWWLPWMGFIFSLTSKLCVCFFVCVCVFFFFFFAINPHILLVSQAASIGNVLVW